MDYRNELNPEQYDATVTTDGPLLILAGAGTGKTRTIAYRAAYLIEKGVSSGEILMLTFTNKAATEMKERVTGLIGEDAAKNLTACTFHSFCSKMLRRFHKNAEIEQDFTIIDAGDDADIINIVKAESTEHRYDKLGFPPSAKVVSMISMMLNKDIPICEVLEDQKFSRYADFEDDILELYGKAQEYKHANSMVDYDDLLVCMNSLLDRHPETAERISGIYTYIMVDEYQDTNTLQDSILQKIRKNNTNLAVVGDDMQSLYGFRGADVQNIITFPQRMPGSRIIKLVRNYRSNQEILDLANHVVKKSTEGFVKDLVGTYSAGTKPRLVTTYDQTTESEYVVSLIRELHENRGVDYDNICILARNSFITVGVELALTQAGQGFVKYGGQKFFELEYVKTVLSYMRVIARTGDEIAWFRIVKLYPGIGDKTARKIAGECKEHGIGYLKDKSFTRRKYQKGLAELHDKLIELQDMPFAEMTKEIIDFYIRVNREYIMHMNVRDESSRYKYLDENESHAQNLTALLPIVERYRSITEFLEELVLDNTEVTQNRPKEDCIVISTVHSVKGLEFDAVIIMDCVDEVFPSTTEDESGGKEDNEELRCFYVAVTRAKKYLYMISPMKLTVFGRQVNGRTSHFLDGGNAFYDRIRM